MGGLARALPRQTAVHRKAGRQRRTRPEISRRRDASRASQATHLARLKAMDRYPGCTFTSPDNLAKHILSSAILDLLVKAYAEELARERDVAEGFIKEMAKRVAGDKALDFDGMKQQVQKAIEIYETEIAGRPTETNIDASVDAALAKARAQVDQGQSRLARDTLRRAAEAMRHEEDERRERYVAGATLLYNRERDIALAAYDGEAAAEAIVALAQALHGSNVAATATFLNSEAQALEDYGRDRGSNVHLVAAIALRSRLVALASSDDERGRAHHNLGTALQTLGSRESGTARLEEAVAAYRAALQEWTRERVPLDWAATQNNLGNALRALGERESGTARLEEAVAAYRAALKEWTRERVPLDWAGTQNNLGNCARNARRAGERHGAARGGGRGLSRGAAGMDARAGSARLGGDSEQSRHCARNARRAGERHGAARGGGRGLSCGAAGMDARAGSAPMGGDPEQSRHCAANAWLAGGRHGAARGGGRGLSCGADGADARAGAARLGDDSEQSRQCARNARRAGERHGAARGGGRGLSCGAAGIDARAGSAPMGDDPPQSRQCARKARRAGGRHGAARGGGRGLSCGADGADARAGAARLGGELRQSGGRPDADSGAHQRSCRRGGRRTAD